MVAASTNTLEYQILITKNDFQGAFQELSAQTEKMGQLTAQTGKKMDAVFDKNSSAQGLQHLSNNMRAFGKVTQNSFNAGAMSASRFDGRLLSLLFTGMALQRAFQGILRSFVNTFQKAEGDTSELRQSTTRLSAAWEFLKFSIFDALNTPFFINIIDGIVKVLNFFSQLTPKAKLSILAVIAGLTLLGGALMVIAQISLAWKAIMGVGGFLSQLAIMMGPAGMLALMGGIALIALAFSSEFDTVKDIFNAFKGDIAKAAKEFWEKFNEFANILGWENALNMLADMGVWVFGTFNIAVQTLLESLTNTFNIIIDILQVGKGLLDYIKGAGEFIYDVTVLPAKMVYQGVEGIAKKGDFSSLGGTLKDTFLDHSEIKDVAIAAKDIGVGLGELTYDSYKAQVGLIAGPIKGGFKLVNTINSSKSSREFEKINNALHPINNMFSELNANGQSLSSPFVLSTEALREMISSTEEAKKSQTILATVYNEVANPAVEAFKKILDGTVETETKLATEVTPIVVSATDARIEAMDKETKSYSNANEQLSKLIDLQSQVAGLGSGDFNINSLADLSSVTDS